MKEYIVELAAATRAAPDLRLGASPRAALHLLRAAPGPAALDGRDYVLPDDIQALAVPVLAHRLLPTAEAWSSGSRPSRWSPGSSRRRRCRSPDAGLTGYARRCSGR